MLRDIESHWVRRYVGASRSAEAAAIVEDVAPIDGHHGIRDTGDAAPCTAGLVS